jgi:hypothetical protein
MGGMREPRTSRGSVALRKAAKKHGSIRKLSKRLGFDTHANVMRWANGDRVPDASSRLLLRKKLSIGFAAWDKAAE